jgi:hypothetical protein
MAIQLSASHENTRGLKDHNNAKPTVASEWRGRNIPEQANSQYYMCPKYKNGFAISQ